MHASGVRGMKGQHGHWWTSRGREAAGARRRFLKP